MMEERREEDEDEEAAEEQEEVKLVTVYAVRRLELPEAPGCVL